MSSSTSPIKVGIAGLGRSGWDIHAAHLRQLPEIFQISAVIDGNPDRVKDATNEFKCKSYQSYQELIQDPDLELVVVAMPNHLHADYSIQALEAGKNVVCEKPMATSLDEADQMIAASEKSGKTLSIFQNRRYVPAFVKAQEIIASGKLGRIVNIKLSALGFARRWDWQTLKEFGGGTLNNTGPHFLDQALQYFGDEEPEVFCKLDKTLTLGDADDHVKVILSHPKAPTVEVEISACSPYPQDSLHIMGTQGGLRGNDAKLECKYINPADLENREVDKRPTPGRSYNRESYDFKEETWEAEKDGRLFSLAFYEDLFETIRNGKALHITPESVRRQIWLINECHRKSPV